MARLWRGFNTTNSTFKLRFLDGNNFLNGLDNGDIFIEEINIIIVPILVIFVRKPLVNAIIILVVKFETRKLSLQVEMIALPTPIRVVDFERYALLPRHIPPLVYRCYQTILVVLTSGAREVRVHGMIESAEAFVGEVNEVLWDHCIFKIAAYMSQTCTKLQTLSHRIPSFLKLLNLPALSRI